MLTVRCKCANHSSFLTFLPTWPHTSYNFPSGASDRVDIYNGFTGAWTTAVLSLARSFLSAVALPTQGLLIFAGGRTTTGASSRVDIFNGVSGSWISDELSTAREGFMGTSLSNLAIFAGGSFDSGDELLGARGFCFTHLPSCRHYIASLSLTRCIQTHLQLWISSLPFSRPRKLFRKMRAFQQCAIHALRALTAVRVMSLARFVLQVFTLACFQS
jgi:hypothetical protein